MATNPGNPGSRRTTRPDLTGEDRDPLNPMQEPLGSMDRPGRRTSDINEVNLPPGETVRRTGNLGTTNAGTTRGSRSFTTLGGRDLETCLFRRFRLENAFRRDGHGHQDKNGSQEGTDAHVHI